MFARMNRWSIAALLTMTGVFGLSAGNACAQCARGGQQQGRPPASPMQQQLGMRQQYMQQQYALHQQYALIAALQRQYALIAIMQANAGAVAGRSR